MFLEARNGFVDKLWARMEYASLLACGESRSGEIIRFLRLLHGPSRRLGDRFAMNMMKLKGSWMITQIGTMIIGWEGDGERCWGGGNLCVDGAQLQSRGRRGPSGLIHDSQGQWIVGFHVFEQGETR